MLHPWILHQVISTLIRIFFEQEGLFINTIVWDVTPCSSEEFNGRFGRKYCLNLKGRRVNKTADVKQNLLCDPECESSTFMRNIGGLYPTTWRYSPEDGKFHSHRCENLKSNRGS
jgi:hypothetical protein